MNLETPLAAIAIALGLAALVISWRRPSEMEKLFRNRINELSADLKETKDRLQETENQLKLVVKENLRLQLLVIWLQKQLIEHGIDIPKLPDYLNESSGDKGKLLIQLNQGGVQVAGDATTKDIVGGDKNLKP